MTRDEVGMILFRIDIRGEEAFLVKLYRDGTIIRNGAGGVPAVGVGYMMTQAGAHTWAEVMGSLPDDIFNMNMAHRAEGIRDPFSYTIVFYGQSRNGQTGEYADWARSQGVRVESDLNAREHHPMLPWLDRFSVQLTLLTNSTYFDAVVLSQFGCRSDQLKGIMISSPPSEQAREESWRQFLTQFTQSPHRGLLPKLPEGKIYTRESDGATFRMELKQEGNSINYYFHPAVPN